MDAMKKYLRQVKACLPGTRKENAWIINQIREQIMDAYSSPTYAEIVELLGTPDRIAGEQIGNMKMELVAQRVRRDRWVKKLVITTVIAFFLAFIIYLTAALVSVRHSSERTIIVEPAIVTIDETNPKIPGETIDETMKEETSKDTH